MNKICTSIEQSKKLIELGININTADNYYSWHDEQYYVVNKDCPYPYSLKEKIPCWSIAALLDVIPQEIFDGEYIINITEGCDNRWVLTYDHFENRNHSYYSLSIGADNLVNACYEMIIKLSKLKIL